MKILHTSDWHLGQKFIGLSRDPEHERALDWLLETIREEQIEVLVVSGDIFDVNNPPVTAEALYYRFLARLVGSNCRHVVIIGGNHDSPVKLEAPKKLLQALGIHIVGCVPDDPAEALLVLPDAAGAPMLAVAAVPFLRDRDFQAGQAGEQTADRIERIKAGIYAWYEQMAALTEPYRHLPRITTGHLYAKGASAGEEQQNIYIGNLENISAEQFPDIFQYVALGHIHRPQKVGKKEHIRYCGSLIPLSFSEIKDKKIVLVVELSGADKPPVVREIAVPVYRRLVSIKGALAKVEEKIAQAHDPEAALPAWLEVVVEGDAGVPALDRYLRDQVKGLNVEILKVRQERTHKSLDEVAPPESLESLDPETVFLKRCESAGLSEEETKNLLLSFRELREWVGERE